MEERLNKVKETLEMYDQTHLIKFFDELDNNQKQEILNQIDNIDFELVKKLFLNKDEVIDTQNKIEPISYIDKLKMSNEEIQKYTKLGEDIIRQGEYAFATLAGGQGTRLRA